MRKKHENFHGRDGPRLTRLLLTVLVTAGMLWATGRADAAEPGGRPSILFCIADDWSWPHAGGYGDRVVKTPAFDRIAGEGVLFSRAFCASPSCTPSRAAILTGQAPHRLEAGGNLWAFLPAKYPVYPDQLEASGYTVGMQGKGWSPGRVVDRPRNPAGPPARSFEQFLASVPEGKPFCYWFGGTDPHRPYDLGSGAEAGLKASDVMVPPYLPDTPEVRNDLLDYYAEVQRFDRQVGEMLALLERSGRLDTTIVVMTSDNGMPFPRCKANLYDAGSRVPLAIRWGAKAKRGTKVEAFVSLTDLCPTFLEAAGLHAAPEMTGRSLVGLLTGAGGDAGPRDKVFVERERHANVRQGDGSYPSRALRTDKFMYVRNLRPDRWPAGDPTMWRAVGPFGDIDPGPTKQLILDGRDDPTLAPFFTLACAKRPAEELFDVAKDPHQLKNVAGDAAYAEALHTLRREMDEWMSRTGDPRAEGGGQYDAFDKYPYFGGDARGTMESRPRGQRQNPSRPNPARSNGGPVRERN
jgi:arylsulfatase A-like enzyme